MKFETQDMQGKVCLVTGATAGIGEATSLLLAQQGATVVGIGRNPAKNEASTQMIKEKSMGTRLPNIFISTPRHYSTYFLSISQSLSTQSR